MFKVACVQTNSTSNIDENIERVSSLITDSAKAGANLVLVPENVTMMEAKNSNAFIKSKLEKDHPAVPIFKQLARRLKIFLLIGSLAIKKSSRSKMIFNRSMFINDKGEIIARYDKIHMFDVQLKNNESYSESKIYQAGNDAVLARTPWGVLGMTICYDLRFPVLYRKLAQRGAYFLSVPSAFTQFTGKDHWHVLLRARAIENGCFIFAPAQCGKHPGNRKTFGHSLIVDPWGKIIAEAKNGVGYILANIDTRLVVKARSMIPSLQKNAKFNIQKMSKF